jgi:hypothetical protein
MAKMGHVADFSLTNKKWCHDFHAPPREGPKGRKKLRCQHESTAKNNTGILAGYGRSAGRRRGPSCHHKGGDPRKKLLLLIKDMGLLPSLQLKLGVLKYFKYVFEAINATCTSKTKTFLQPTMSK